MPPLAALESPRRRWTSPEVDKLGICFRGCSLFVNTHCRAASAFPGISTQPSRCFQARSFLRTKFHPKPLQVSVTGDSQQCRLYFSSSISLKFVRVPATQKKPTAGSWLNTNSSGDRAPWISALKGLGKKVPNKKMTGAECCMVTFYPSLKREGNKCNSS